MNKQERANNNERKKNKQPESMNRRYETEWWQMQELEGVNQKYANNKLWTRKNDIFANM